MHAMAAQTEAVPSPSYHPLSLPTTVQARRRPESKVIIRLSEEYAKGAWTLAMPV
jgi:hypothetical protein